MMNRIRNLIEDRIVAGKKSLVVLIDPDKIPSSSLVDRLGIVNKTSQFILVGGSFVEQQDLENCLTAISIHSTLPVCLFPGHATQVSEQADAMLFMTLVSGRNPEFLIGHQVAAAPSVAKSQIEVLPTGYMLVNCGKQTAAEYMSNTQAIPYEQTGIAVATALASKFMGQQYIYMDGGSGADKCISEDMISAVKKATGLPLIVGGGIRSAAQAKQVWDAGADIVVVGNGAEERVELLEEIAALI